MRIIELRPIRESTEDYATVEARIIALLKKEIYAPLMVELKEPQALLTNARWSLSKALYSGQVRFWQGAFTGRFSATVSKELKELGARWDRKTETWRIQLSDIPIEYQSLIRSSEYRFQKRLELMDKKLAEMSPQAIAEKLKCADAFDKTLYKTDKDFQKSVSRIAIAPKLTEAQRKKLADEWQNNMQLWIQKFSEKQITQLRKTVQQTIFSGKRYETLIGSIQKSYSVSENKAKFLARQETSLLMTSFKEARYQDYGIKHYRWGCVTGTKCHPVRPWHLDLKDTVQRFDRPPISTDVLGKYGKPQPARRNNPGRDFGCRCYARPVLITGR